jgi:hypothetical protein
VLNGYEYRVTPLDQASNVLAGVMYRNNGSQDQTNVGVLVQIFNNQAEEIWAVSTTLDVIPANSNAPTCPANERDTLYVQTNWTPTQEGVYELRVTMFGQEMDANAANNTMSKEMVYSADVFGHDNENELTDELWPWESDMNESYFEPTGYGSCLVF